MAKKLGNNLKGTIVSVGLIMGLHVKNAYHLRNDRNISLLIYSDYYL